MTAVTLDPPPLSGHRALFVRSSGYEHWAYEYAARVRGRARPGHSPLIQTSMSPSGSFHVGNFRDTVTAHLIWRALQSTGQAARILLSFDDYDPHRGGRPTASNDPAGRPLGADVDLARQRCRAYLAELKAVGICPAEADADGIAEGTHWLTHYQYDRYRAGEYVALQHRLQRDAAQLARLLGVARPERLFAVYCEVCGRNTTSIDVLDERSARYRCAVCGTRRTTDDLTVVKPAWALDWVLRVLHEGIDCEPAGWDHCSAGSTMDRTQVVFGDYVGSPQPVIVPYALVRAPVGHQKISGSQGGGLVVSDLLAVLPPELIIWLFGRRDCMTDFRLGLHRAAIFGYYDEWDAFVAKAAAGGRERALYDLISDDPPPAPLPRWRAVVAAVQSACFDTDRAYAALADPALDDDRLRARILHAAAWLRDAGRDEAWIVAHADPAPGTLASDPGSREEYRDWYRAVFGTHSGPPRAQLLEQFPALATDPASMRDHVLALLDGAR